MKKKALLDIALLLTKQKKEIYMLGMVDFYQNIKEMVLLLNSLTLWLGELET